MNVTGDNGQETNQIKTNNIGEKGEKKLMDVNKKTSIFDHAPLAAPEDDSDNNDHDDDNEDYDDDDLDEAHYTQIKDVLHKNSSGMILGSSSGGVHIGGSMHRDRGDIGDNEMHLMTFSHDSTPNKTKLRHRLRDKGQQSMIIFLSLVIFFKSMLLLIVLCDLFSQKYKKLLPKKNLSKTKQLHLAKKDELFTYS